MRIKMSSLKSQEPPHPPPFLLPQHSTTLCSSKSSLLEFLPKSNSSPFQFSVSVISFPCLMSMSPLLSVQSVQTESEHFAIEVSVPLFNTEEKMLKSGKYQFKSQKKMKIAAF